ncbi:dihydrofolate reductase [Microbacteriaceae bacterium SG_E_30_P1]|uniref:Dihydrofolate reductase n=1 Tax=Antiquaquibacter oligotrophicus TaxID=2880260 RepID=A0ABT6KPE4_9MICO|nr:dihydrofolate reductase family protein [Antiquaquibacter oligotrophicus]MDH6181343.1 dihydrofolate reductase [Antiquaquibacter oligotrophicus]UDF12964.1 dihydrofolate reductase family protein [Antiquaquibacter oligotrophicus]
MARLVYTAFTSLDGFISDEEGNFDWAMPDEHVHQLANDLDRTIGTHVNGRKLYETMVYWETAPPDNPIADQYGAIWRAADKVVVSRTLDEPASARTTILREFTTEWLENLKNSASRDIAIGGPTLAAQAFDLIDDLHLVVFPVIVGGGTRYLPSGAAARLTLVGSRTFDSGVVYLHYRKHR